MSKKNEDPLVQKARDLYLRAKKLDDEAVHLKSYLDSIEFLAIGVVFGVLGGIWGNLLTARLTSLFGSYSLGILALLTLPILYLCSFPIRRARKTIDRHGTEMSQINDEFAAITREVEL